MFEVELKLVKDEIDGVSFTFLDTVTSLTVPEVFSELKNGMYGLNEIKLEPNDVVIDVGANVGMFSIFINKRFGCKIIAFEPVRENYENFKRNILLNGLNPENFEIHNVAVSHKQGEKIKIGIQEWNYGGSSVYFNNNSNFQVCETVNLLDYISPDCKYLKLDCEGAEYDILPSITEKINYFKYIGIELHELEDSVHNPDETYMNLKRVFKGTLFPNELGMIPKIVSYAL